MSTGRRTSATSTFSSGSPSCSPVLMVDLKCDDLIQLLYRPSNAARWALTASIHPTTRSPLTPRAARRPVCPRLPLSTAERSQTPQRALGARRACVVDVEACRRLARGCSALALTAPHGLPRLSAESQPEPEPSTEHHPTQALHVRDPRHAHRRAALRRRCRRRCSTRSSRT